MMRLVLVVLFALALGACKKPDATSADPTTAASPSGAPGAPGASAPETKAASASVVRGKVLEKIDAAPYVYLKLSGPAGETWAAVPQAAVSVGSEVVVENPMQMDGFESKSLSRKFDKIVFGTLAGQGGAAAAGPAGMAPVPSGVAGAMPSAMAAQHAAAGAGPADVGDVKVPKATGANAKNIAEIYSQKAQLKDKSVTVRGKVLKYNSGILGKNWLHVRDGSGAQSSGDNDVTVTTDGQAAVGDVVLVTGTVRLNKDFGAGYMYPLIIEEATLAK